MNGYSLMEYTVHANYLKKCRELKWYQFKALRELNAWYDKQIEKINKRIEQDKNLEL